VDLIFINNRFSHKVRGIFRHILRASTLKEIRDLLSEMDLQLGMKLENWEQLLGRHKQQGNS